MPNFGELPFVFSAPDLDRLAIHRHDDVQYAALRADSTTRFVPVCGDDNILLADGVTPLLMDVTTVQPVLAEAHCTVLLGSFQGHPHLAIGLSAGVVLSNDKLTLTNLRPQFGVLDHGTLALLGYARAMVHWHLQNRYCGKCGAPTHSRHAGHELHCSRCGNILYPRINPAIIVLVTHRDRCLLGRQKSANRYSTLAGFVEPGENLEACVRREVREETNIRVACMQYRASQPWPYPGSLMLGFHAQAENTDIHCNDGELAEARWFSRAAIIQGLRNNSLTLSTPQSISHWLLREWFEETGEFTLANFNPVDTHDARS
ncbi:MAG TPA: NAD(+) diphosphatase [Gammaproteobacteria bacterium]|nr:NAD(+) diphosphatase [Gammaproteobacteria bacterium]